MKELKEVRKERSGFRDASLDRLLNRNGIIQTDSFLVTEYNHGKSVAIIEYKDSGKEHKPDIRLVNYCDMRKNNEYYFIILFNYEKAGNKYRISHFTVYSGNKNASDFLLKEYGSEDEVTLIETEFIGFLYKIRGNTTSVYYEKALKDYTEWFTLDQSEQSYKSIISSRHRNYAYDVPAADIDSFMCDEHKIPYLFIEYKVNYNYGSKVDRGHNYFINENISFHTNTLTEEGKKRVWNKAIADLGNGCKDPLPVIAVKYSIENDIFSVYAFNEIAEKRVTLKSMTQAEYLSYIKNPENFRKRAEKICPKCGGKIVLRNGAYGPFYGCENFKRLGCRYTESIPKAEKERLMKSA